MPLTFQVASFIGCRPPASAVGPAESRRAESWKPRA